MITNNSAGTPISTAFVQAIGRVVVGFDAKLLIGSREVDATIHRLTYGLGASGDESVGGGLPIGSTYSTHLEAQLVDYADAVSGAELELRIGVDVGGSYEYVTVGVVTVTQVRHAPNGVTTVEAWGRVASVLGIKPLGLAAGEYAASALASSISSASGVSVTLGAFTSTSRTVHVDAGWSCRRALSSLALALGGFAADTNDGAVLVSPLPTSATCSISDDLITSLPSMDEHDYEIDGLTVEVPDSQGGIAATYTYGSGRVHVSDDGGTQATSDVLWGNISGKAYRPGTVGVSVLDPRITPFDAATVPYGETSVFLPTFGVLATYDGGLFGSLSAPGTSEESEAMDGDGPLAASVANIGMAAAIARAHADGAAEAAYRAQTSANSAASAAAQAQADATAAGTAAQQARSEAAAASTSATQALASATQASNSATNALTQLSFVEDVVGTLSWIQDHATFAASSDTTVDTSKVYFELVQGDYIPITQPNPSANPSTSGWYEIDVTQAQGEYIMSHLAVTSRGLWVLPSGIDGSDAQHSSGYKTLLASDGSYVYDGTGALVARYGSVTEFYAGGKSMVEIGSSGARIGATDTSHVEIDYHSLRLIDKEGDTYFVVSDLRNSEGWVDIEEEIRPATSPYTSSTEFALSLQATDANYVVTVDGVERTTGIRKYVTRFLFDDPIPSESSEIIASYRTESQNAKAFTFGSRRSNSDVGGLSLTEGYDTEASGTFSHAEGRASRAIGYASHAEGTAYAEGYASHAEGGSGHAWGRYSHKEGGNNVASGHASHAEGDGAEASGYISHAEGSGLAASSYSHAEGYLTKATGQGGSNHAEGSRTTASGAASHAEGYRTTASGDYSHAGGEGTTAASDWQTVIGKHNEVDGSGRFPLIIGNGTDENNLSNALAVDWNGNVTSDGGLLKLDNAQGETRTYLQAVEESTLNRTRLGTHRAVNGSDVYNNLNLVIDSSGNRSVAVSEVAPWLDMLGLSVSSTTATVGAAAASIGTNSVRRSGKVVTVTLASIQLASAISNNSYSGTIATIPSGYRPASSVYGACFAAGANLGGSYARITNAGVVAIRNQSGSSIAASTTVLPALSITYIID